MRSWTRSCGIGWSRTSRWRSINDEFLIMFDDLTDLYQQLILDHNKSPRNFRVLPDANRTAQGTNPICGDNYTLYAKMDGDVVKEISFQGTGCAISKASASILTESLKGRTMAEVKSLFDKVRDMVTTGKFGRRCWQTGRAGRRAQIPRPHKMRDPAVARGDMGAGASRILALRVLSCTGATVPGRRSIPQLGPTTQTVRVTASAAQLQTESAAVTITPRQYLDKSAAFQQSTATLTDTLLMYLPGQTYLASGRNVSAYGSRSYDRRINLDGAAIGFVSGGFREPRGTTQDMEASSLNADASHQTASTSEMFTSKGANAVHGAIWTELQNAALNALNFATRIPRGPGIPSVGYGYILGGPCTSPSYTTVATRRSSSQHCKNTRRLSLGTYRWPCRRML